MKNEDYIHIMGFMVNELGLRSNELLAYAIVHGYSKNQQGEFKGSISYLEKLLSCTRPTVIKTMNSLEEKGLIIKTKEQIGRNEYNRYVVTPCKENLLVKKLNTGSKKTLHGTSKKTLHHKGNTIKGNTIENTSLNLPFKKEEEKDAPVKSDSIDFEKLLQFINEKTGRKYKVINEKVRTKYKSAIRQGYGKDTIMNAIHNACLSKHHIENNLNYLTPEFFSRTEKLDLYGYQPKQKTLKEITQEGGHRNF